MCGLASSSLCSDSALAVDSARIVSAVDQTKVHEPHKCHVFVGRHSIEVSEKSVHIEACMTTVTTLSKLFTKLTKLTKLSLDVAPITLTIFPPVIWN